MQKFERELLIRLAPIWLACRWRICGNSLHGAHWPKPDLSFDFLGCNDYSREMVLSCKEVLANIRHAD